ncbi:MAG: hypothetical protein PWR01_2043 [Clostridiales bacterium]|jgi:hypothetical protein|nr:hypothetical protein [Clostridiales bacterium]MDN5280970.1 hypothetical protein [Candidatus Ozemobacter sp.]
MPENKPGQGQETLHKVGNYFDKYDVKPPVDDPEQVTLQSAQENIKAVNRYFKSGTYDLEIFLALLLPAILILTFLFLYRRDAGKTLDLDEIPEKDFDFIEMVRLQKGLEEFDRDFLLQLSVENSIAPLYQILIDKGVFEKIETRIMNEISEKGENASQNKRVRYLRKLKMKLF